MYRRRVYFGSYVLTYLLENRKHRRDLKPCLPFNVLIIQKSTTFSFCFV